MSLNRKINFLAFLILLAVVLFSGCRPKLAGTSATPLSKTSFLLGTVVEISMYDKQDEEIIDKALSRISEIEAKMTINNADTSEIIALNNASGKNEVKLSPDTFHVVERGRQYSELTGGRFDITVGSIVKLWNIGTDFAAVPEKSELEKAVRLIDYNKLILDKENLTARLLEPGMQVDLGAIAKGYSADETARILRENGVKHAIINLGGNVVAVGGNPNGKPWKIGVQDPFNSRGNFIGIVPVIDKSVVTSGTYERYFEANGRKYHHILDTATGYPIENNLYSVTIITEESIDGDGLSTTALILGLKEGMKLVGELEGVEAIFITADKKVYATPGIRDELTITNPEFVLAN